MRRRDSRIALIDAVNAGDAVLRYLGTTTFEEFASDEVLIDAVCRRFEIVGEALNRALRADPSLTVGLPDALKVIGLRNVLAHGYDVVSEEKIYGYAMQSLPQLLECMRRVID